MAIALYIDHHIPRAITYGLRLRNVDCLTALEDHAAEVGDPDLLDRATALSRALVTSDKDFLVEAERRQAGGIAFAGVIYTHAVRVSVRTCLDDLEIIAKTGEPEDLANRVQFLPL
jgi:Domain of unknown function (DUF5615)